jgi:hypothetical protein
MTARKKLGIWIGVIVLWLAGLFFTYECSKPGREIIKMAPKIPEAIVQYSEIAVESQIAKYKFEKKPEIVRVDKEGEIWIIFLNKKAAKEVEKNGAVVRLHIGYCYWESNIIINRMVGFSEPAWWHPPYSKNRVIAELVDKNKKPICAVIAW